MRLVKLTDELLDGNLDDYFGVVLTARNPPGLFRCPRGRIGRDALREGETLLFSYHGKILYVAKTQTGRIENMQLPHPKYPHCFVIDMHTVRPTEFSIQVLEDKLREAHCLNKSFRGRGWTIIPDSDRAEEIVDALVG